MSWLRMMQFLLVLCGLPASGKTTLARALQKAFDFDVLIVTSDDWRDSAYYADWKPEKEGQVRQTSLMRVQELVEQGRNVIHDDTNYYNSMRHDLYEIARKNQCGFAIIHVSTSLEMALKWNRKRDGNQIPDSVIEKISERFDPPGRRYLWDNAIAEVDMASQDLDTIVPKIVGHIQELRPTKDSALEADTRTELERADSETRRIVSEFLDEHPELRGNRRVSEVRKDVLRTANLSKESSRDIEDQLLRELAKLL